MTIDINVVGVFVGHNLIGIRSGCGVGKSYTDIIKMHPPAQAGSVSCSKMHVVHTCTLVVMRHVLVCPSTSQYLFGTTDESCCPVQERGTNKPMLRFQFDTLGTTWVVFLNAPPQNKYQTIDGDGQTDGDTRRRRSTGDEPSGRTTHDEDGRTTVSATDERRMSGGRRRWTSINTCKQVKL